MLNDTIKIHCKETPHAIHACCYQPNLPVGWLVVQWSLNTHKSTAKMCSHPLFCMFTLSLSWCTICLYCCQRLLLYLNNLFTFWRALSNQTVPYQALTKIMKRETTKIEKWKWYSRSPHLIPQNSVFPSPRPSWSLSLSLAISCQCLFHWTNHLAAKLNAVCKIESFQSLPACWKKNISIPPHSSSF